MLIFNERTGEFEERLGPGEKPTIGSSSSSSSYDSSSSSSAYSTSPSSDSSESLGINRDQVRDKVYDILTDILYIDYDEIEDDSFIEDDLGADDIDKADIIERVEEEFDIIILEDEAYSVDTVEELVDLVCENLYLDEDDEFLEADDDWVPDDDGIEDDDDQDEFLEPDEDWIPDDDDDDFLEPDEDWIPDDDDDDFLESDEDCMWDDDVNPLDMVRKDIARRVNDALEDIKKSKSVGEVFSTIAKTFGKGSSSPSFSKNNSPSFIFTNKNLGRDDIRQHVFDVIAYKLSVDYDDISEKATFFSDLGADSLDVVELLMTLEKDFGISIPDDQAEKIVTVGDAIDYIYFNLH